MTKEMKKGDFVKVYKDVGVIVALEKEKNIPKNHFGIWFGETELNIPIYKTVPKEYCKLASNIKSYH